MSARPAWWAQGRTVSLQAAAKATGRHPDRLAALARPSPFGKRVALDDLRRWAAEQAPDLDPDAVVEQAEAEAEHKPDSLEADSPEPTARVPRDIRERLRRR